MYVGPKVIEAAINERLALTECPPATTFNPFRGHLSRPACSHVKQLAKQAGDRVDPGRTFVQGRVFYGLILSVEPPRGEGRHDDKRAFDPEPLDPQRGSRA